ncbi:bifunctional folylpolyglutamate synthase/dihydrofolate synthase [Kaistia geumhonensis]|uniref:Dihydrofolate synthase/folylpolyglutamate synthase n=1 Tax=Kaistia geumhonensis TaxID=410839 RepID=A0ABU0M7E5_9HYPH|nr:folylpolyglutamate synthase/dihydrofolate synthase family protein [Kaistia geumhonensis]MCX5477894.1 bifunctional folylpolyglutamate synthase/dihydrofolate synthase [Kaistia geumhonensis]MDQ0516893.1 dihydrofolate synthase/folylpolyglutamate synthase [Kaistia geumhonensis]
MDYSAAILERLFRLHPKDIDLSLERLLPLLEKLGHPERKLGTVFHIAGTNGKGSTTAFLRAMLEASGRTVHVYTSPHLVSFHERIRLGRPGGGQHVSEDELVATLTDVERLNDGAPITQFEITTAAAFALFAAHPADVTLLEVGLGGRYDATNVIDAPDVSVITSISMDHERFLGDRIEMIAGEKAGIIKRGRPVVVAPQTSEVLAVIERESERKRAPLFVGNRDWIAHAERGRLVFQDEHGLVDLPAPRLPGRHQFVNAGNAVAALRHSSLSVPQSAIEAGLSGVDWPARMQRLSTGALLALAPPEAELWLDGGHNPGAGAVIAEAVADLEERLPRPLYLVAGMLQTKDPVGFFRPFAGLAAHVFTVPIASSSAGRDPRELAEAAREAGLEAEATSDVPAALAALGRMLPPGTVPRILICGSLYLAGDVLDLNGTPPR